MSKRKATEIEADPSDQPSKQAKLTQDEPLQDEPLLDDDIQASSGDASTVNNATESGSGAQDESTVITSDPSNDGATPKSPQDGAIEDSTKDSAATSDAEKQTKSKKKGKAPVKPKGTTTNAPRKTRSKKAAPAEPTTPPPAKPKRINRVVKAKIEGIKSFLDSIDESETVLERDPANTSLITLTRSHLIAALMTMRSDYGVGDPMWADISTDMQEAVVREFEAPLRIYTTEWVVLDVEIETEIERQIKQKIEGWGLEDAKLLEVELEIVGRQRETGAVVHLIKKVAEGMADETKEVEKRGVCPMPKKDVV